MASYMELIRKDVLRHTSCDTSSWPSRVSEFAQSLQNELRIPSWFKADCARCANEGLTDVLGQLCMSDDANLDLWDSSDKIMQEEMEWRLRTAFNTALADCARIRAVVEAERLTDTPFPKESFLVILVRNAIFATSERLSSLEDTPVVLPRHFSGEAIPILSYMKKSLYAPLVVSCSQEMPVKEKGSDLGQQLSDKDDSSVDLGLSGSEYSPPSLSEWLEACERPKTPEKTEEEQEEGLLSPQFEPYFLAFSLSATPPSACHIPVLCMADEEQLPILLSSLLYQRRMWRISDPLVGFQFSKYDTTIKLFVGWLEDDLSSYRVLPRVHVGEIRAPLRLDLSSPSVALVISRLLCSLDSHIRAVRDIARHSVGAVISDTQLHPSLSWRIDTDYTQKEDSVPILENNSTQDMVIQWLKTQKHSAGENSTMHPRKRGDKTSLSGSATLSSTPQDSTSTQLFHPLAPPPSSQTSEKRSSSILHQEPDASTQPPSQLSCSDFAATTEKNDHQLFCWMFDRGVVPQPIPNDLEFREEYKAMTCLIWPETWNSRGDLPSVDAALEPCIQELLESVALLKTRLGAVKCVPVEQFPIDLRILKQSFSAIFQASRRSREKVELPEDVCEAAWRHDHDRLLFDFFIRLVQPKKGGTIDRQTLDEGCSITHLEDPLSRPTLETTLRLPKNDCVVKRERLMLQSQMLELLEHRATDLAAWLRTGGHLLKARFNELQHASFVDSQWSAWVRKTTKDIKASMMSDLRRAPLASQCDALGRLLVELPKVSARTINHFPLVVRSARKPWRHGGKEKNKVTTSSSSSPSSFGETETDPSLTSVGDSATEVDTIATRYTIASSSVSSSMYPFDDEQTGSSESLVELAYEVQRLQLGADSTYLELPILTAEYKKASDTSMKGTNQLRMYLAASVKFLQAIGITNFPVYGVQTDGPIVVLPAAVLRDDNFVYLFERLVEKLDISTPVGAWHYATILCRLAQNHGQVLQKKFEEVRDNLVTSLQNGVQLESWTMEHQKVKLGLKKPKS